MPGASRFLFRAILAPGKRSALRRAVPGNYRIELDAWGKGAVADLANSVSNLIAQVRDKNAGSDDAPT